MKFPWSWPRWRHDDEELKASQYRVLELWQQTYEGALRVMLPDTFGTTQFLAGAPDWVADWTGQRVDSKDPYVAGDEYIDWLKARGRDPREKLLIASDTLDVDQILGLHAYFGGALGKRLEPQRFPQRRRFSTIPASGRPAAAFVSAPAGERC